MSNVAHQYSRVDFYLSVEVNLGLYYGGVLGYILYFGGHFEKSALTPSPRMGIFADNLISTCLWISFPKKVVSKNPPGVQVLGC